MYMFCIDMNAHPHQATELITQLQNMYADDTPDEDEEQWESYFALLHTLQGRVEHKVCVCMHMYVVGY